MQLQGHGVVLVLDDEFTIVHISEHCEALLGVSAPELVGAPLTDVLDGIAADHLREWFAVGYEERGWERAQLKGGTLVKLHPFDPGPGRLGLDVLPLPPVTPLTDAQAIERVAGWNQQLFACDSVDELLAAVARIARARTGYDGAWVCRLEASGESVVSAADADGAGDVVGQSVLATDVPPNQPVVRGRRIPFFVADVEALAIRLTPVPDALDIDGSVLLRPFPEFLDRLRTLGVRATASVPIELGGQLWGRILAHHPSARRLSAAIQAELGLLGVVTGVRLTELIELDEARERVELARCSVRAIQAVASAPDLVEGLAKDTAALPGVCAADGALVAIGDRVEVVGLEVEDGERDRVLASVRRALEGGEASVIASRTLDDAAPGDVPTLAGYLAARLSDFGDDLVIWVRREQPVTVTWVDHEVVGGSPQRDLFAGVSSRTEQVRGQSAPWSPAQVQQAEEFRSAVGGVLQARYESMTSSNVELRRANEEYDAFTQAAAHDLKAPLRGIRQTTEFVLLDAGDRISESEREDLTTVVRLASRMDDLLDDLMTYAKVGNVELHPAPVRLRPVVDQVVELLGGTAVGEAAIEVEDTTLVVDPPALQQLLFNLIGNALKYSGGPARIRIGTSTLAAMSRSAPVPDTLAGAPGDTEVLVVADEGIGIDGASHGRVFELFRQLDVGADGTGTGLALCRLIARRHGGDIWVESAPGEGSTFCVVLSA